MRYHWYIAAALLIGAGCDRNEDAAGPAAPPSTRPAEVAVDPSVAPTSNPSDLDPADARVASATTTTTLPTGVTLIVHEGVRDRIYDFPRAKLRLTKEGDRFAGVLYTDDPKTAINSDYNGNSFFLQMKLDIEDPRKLSGVEWMYKSASTVEEESGDGIFLEGTRLHLQPYDAGARLEATTPGMLHVVLGGKFLKFDAGNREPHPTVVEVRGELDAAVDVK